MQERYSGLPETSIGPELIDAASVVLGNDGGESARSAAPWLALSLGLFSLAALAGIRMATTRPRSRRRDKRKRKTNND